MPPNTTYTFTSGTTIESGKVNQNFTDVRTWGADIPDDDLQSPNNSVYRLIFSSKGLLGTDLVAATYMLGSNPHGENIMVASGTSFQVGGSKTGSAPDTFRFEAADYAVTSKTTKLRVRAQVSANATAPAITFTAGLYPATVAGAADFMAFTAGTVVSGSTVAIASPSASTITEGDSGDFTIPSDGDYMLCVVTSGTIANNSAVRVTAQVQARNV